MIKSIKYINHLEEEVLLTGDTYRMHKDTDLFDYAWDAQTKNEYNPTIYQFTRNMVEKKMSISIVGRNNKAYLGARNHLIEVFEKDVYASQMGKIVVNNDYYLPCYIVGKTDIAVYDGAKIARHEFKVLSEKGKWLKEVEKTFGIAQIYGDEGRDFPYDFPYDFAYAGGNIRKLKTDSIVPFDFEITFQGPWSSPSLIANDYKYEILAGIGEREFIKVNSKEKTIKLIRASGEEVNYFRYRSRNRNIFEKMTSIGGITPISVEDGHVATVKAFVERSVPKWT